MDNYRYNLYNNFYYCINVLHIKYCTKLILNHYSCHIKKSLKYLFEIIDQNAEKVFAHTSRHI